MIKTYTIDPGQTATKEQLEEIEEAKKSAITFDNDCRELSPAMMKAFKKALWFREIEKIEHSLLNKGVNFILALF